MSTHPPTLSLEGTLEVIDLTHASDEEAMSTVLRELRARRERRPRRRTGPAVMIERGRLDGARGEQADPAPGDEPRARSRARGRDHGSAGPDAAPFSFADLGAVLREMAGAPEPEMPHAREPALEQAEERAEVEQVFTRRTLIMEDVGAGKRMAAAVVGFGLGAAAMFLARHFRYVPPPPSRRPRPQKPRLSPEEAAWQAQLDEIARRYTDPAGDEEDEEEPSPRGE
jgi:hypothetical protein